MSSEPPPSPRDAALVRRALRARRGRGGVAALGVGTSVLLVLVLFGTYRSVEVGIEEYIGQPQIDLWIAPQGTDNLVRSASLLPDVVAEDVAAMPEVREAAPVLRSFMSAEPERAPGARPSRRGLTLLAIGYRIPSGLGGPPRLAAGRLPAGPREVVLDRAAAYRLGVDVGGAIVLNGHRVSVVGLTSRTNVVSTQFVFLDAGLAGALSGYRGNASFVAVGLHPGARPDEVARRIREDLPGVSVFGRVAFVQRNQEEVFAGFRPIQALVSAIGLVTASILVALLVLATVEDRRRDVAVLFALGAGARLVGGGLLAHSMRLVLLGVGGGAVAALLLSAALDRWIPTVDTALRLADVAAVTAAFAAVGLVGALLPLARLARTDPAEAFRP